MEKHQTLLLTALRQRVGMTQIELALAVDTSQTRVSRWEQGDPIPPDKGIAVLAVLRAKERGQVPSGLKPADLSRPWEEVLLERAGVRR